MSYSKYVHVRTGMYGYVIPVMTCTSTYWYVTAYWYIPLRTILPDPVQVYRSPDVSLHHVVSRLEFLLKGLALAPGQALSLCIAPHLEPPSCNELCHSIWKVTVALYDIIYDTIRH
jgi:hypothetical protein